MRKPALERGRHYRFEVTQNEGIVLSGVVDHDACGVPLASWSFTTISEFINFLHEANGGEQDNIEGEQPSNEPPANTDPGFAEPAGEGEIRPSGMYAEQPYYDVDRGKGMIERRYFRAFDE